jgi:proton-coupled amino acid transporter
MTYFTLLKGFVCTAVLYLPQSFYKGGWLFSFIALTVSLIISVIAILKLLEARDATNARSYMELGTKAYGIKGKNAVGLFLILS